MMAQSRESPCKEAGRAQNSGIGVTGLRCRSQPAFTAVGAEAEQRRNITHVVQCRIGLYEIKVDAAPNGGRNDSFADIVQRTCRSSTQWTIANHVRIDMAAATAFHC